MAKKVAPADGWSPEAILERVRELPEGRLRYSDAMLLLGPGVVRAAYRQFGTWRRAVEAAGFRYPGHHLWRVRYYREDSSRFKQDIGQIPAEKLGSARDFCKEAGLPRPLVRKAKLCQRCGGAFAPIRRTYCDVCRKVQTREKARERMRRWLSTPKGRASLEKLKLQQQLKRIQAKLAQAE